MVAYRKTSESKMSLNGKKNAFSRDKERIKILFG